MQIVMQKLFISENHTTKTKFEFDSLMFINSKQENLIGNQTKIIKSMIEYT